MLLTLYMNCELYKDQGKRSMPAGFFLPKVEKFWPLKLGYNDFSLIHPSMNWYMQTVNIERGITVTVFSI